LVETFTGDNAMTDIAPTVTREEFEEFLKGKEYETKSAEGTSVAAMCYLQGKRMIASAIYSRNPYLPKRLRGSREGNQVYVEYRIYPDSQVPSDRADYVLNALSDMKRQGIPDTHICNLLKEDS
jgi:hypothetical protein